MNNNQNQDNGYRYSGQPNSYGAPGSYGQNPSNRSRPTGTQNPNLNRNVNPGTRPNGNPNVNQNRNMGVNPDAGQNVNKGTARPAANSAQRPSQPMPSAQKRPQEKKLQLTPEQIEINKANRKREVYYQKKMKAQARKTFMARFTVFLAAVVIIGLITLGIFRLSLTHTTSGSESRYTYTIGDEKYKLNYNKAVRDGRVYVSFSDVAELFDFSVTGSSEDMSFIIKSDEDHETIRFLSGSRTAYVNGIETALGSTCYYDDGEMYVPVEFVEAFVNGITVDVNQRSHEVTIQRIITNLGDDGKLPKGEEPEYLDPSFLLQSAQRIQPLSEDDLDDITELPDLGFKLNLTFYEKYMNPGSVTDYLTLVSREYELSADYVPQDLGLLEDTRDDGRTIQQMREYAMYSMEAMFKELRAAGFEDVSITSAYRSYSYQETVFNEYLAQHNYDEEYVSTFSNPPGSSEHQLGLCADLHNLTSADVSFGETEAFAWLRDNCWKFGFILRYPEDKVDVTNISYEPWHYRYVGRFHAQRIYEEGLCLEEYLEKYYPDLIGQPPRDSIAPEL